MVKYNKENDFWEMVMVEEETIREMEINKLFENLEGGNLNG